MKKIIISILILLPIFSFAASTDYTLLEPLPCIQNTGQGVNEQACADGTLIKKINTDTYIAYVFNFSIAFAAVAAVVVITYAGFEYALSDMVTKKSDAKNRIWNAIWGLLTIICSYLILKTIDPRLVDINTKLPVIENLDGYKFDYNGLLDTANSKINQDLTNARLKAKPLEEAAKQKRANAAIFEEQAKKAATPEERLELQNKANEEKQGAIVLEKDAKLIGTEASIKAAYEAGDLLIKDIQGLGDPENPIVDTTIEDRVKYVEGVADRALQNTVYNNDLEAQQKIKELKSYYTSKLTQDALIAKKTKLISSQIDYMRNNDVGRNDPKFKANVKKNMDIAIKEIMELENFPNISEEHALELKNDKEIGVEKLKEIIKTFE